MAESRTPRHVRRAKTARRSEQRPSKGAADRTGSSQGGSDERSLISGTTRLQKILAAAGFGSRRATEQYLRDKRVTVNGRTASLGDSADLGVDVVAVDGEKLAVRSPSYWIMNKPTGVVTTMSDPERRATVADLLPRSLTGVFPVGRLDIDTSGLVLLTNDGALAQILLHPSSGGEKEYVVVVKGEVGATQTGRLETGMMLDDGRTKPARVDSVSYDSDRGTSTLHLVLTEGRKRQIRRSMLVLGRPVKTLRRVRVGPIRLGRLRRGEIRPLRPDEVAALRGYVERLRAGEKPEIPPSKPAPKRPSTRGKTAPKRSRSRGKAAPKRSSTRGKAAPKRSSTRAKADKTAAPAKRGAAVTQRPISSGSKASAQPTARVKATRSSQPKRSPAGAAKTAKPGRSQARSPRKGKRK